MANIISDVFFDLDHTLWDFEKNSAIAFEIVFGIYRVKVGIEEFLSHYIPVNLKYWTLYRDEKISQDELRYGRLAEVFGAIGYEIDKAKIDVLATAYIHYLPQCNHLFEGAIEILDYLKAKYRLHIITNGFADVQHKKLENAQISHYFETVTNSEIAGVKKPNPIIFEHALSLSGARKERSVMIGDCIDADVRGALACGFDAIWFSETTFGKNGVKHVSHLSELKKYL